MKSKTSITDENLGRPASLWPLKLTHLIYLQAAYCLAGIVYNGISLLFVRMLGRGLSPTDPVMGMVVMAAYGGCLVVGVLGYHRIYRILMGCAVIALGYGGVVVHIQRYFSGLLFFYDSRCAWGAAVLINLFGLVLNVIAAAGWFRTTEKGTNAS